jgi:competence protein ComEC
VLQLASELPAPSMLWSLAVLCAGAWPLAWLAARRPKRWIALGLVVTAAAGLGYGQAGLRAQARLADTLAAADEGRDVRVRGIVASLPAAFEGGVRFALEVDAVADPAMHVPARLALSWYEPGRVVLPAQRWDLSVRLRRPHGNLNPGGFDAEAWMLEQGIRAQGTVRAGRHDAPPVLLEERVLRFNPLVDRARALLRERLQEALRARRYGSVIVALVMGDQGPITEEDWALFNRTGISHLVSISGLHITMIAAAVALCAGALWRRSAALLRLADLPTVRALAGIGGGYAYCLLAGWGVPAQRTLLMLGTFALAQCWRTRLAPALVLAAAAALVCALDPWAVLAAGFWLSFGAVACIFLAVSGRLAPGEGWRGRLREGLRLQGAITIGQMPMTLAIFGQVSVVAPLANALAIPLVSYLVAPLALVGAGLLACGPAAALGTPLLDGAETLFGLLALFLQALTQPGWSWICLPAPPAWAFACAALGCAWLLAPPGWPMRCSGALWLLPLFCWPVDRPGPDELRVTALDVGQGMSLVLESAEAVVVFDTGPRYGADSDAGGRVLVPYLRGRGIRQVDLLVVSHQDIDHAGGAVSLLRALPVQRVWSSVDPGHRLLAGAAAVQRCAAGQRLQLGALSLAVLSPPAALYAQPRASTNARSCVVLAQRAGRSVLLTGDIPARQERQMVQAAPQLAALAPLDLLVAPHHGSHSSSSEILLDATRPRWVSMQLGYRNHFGHPHAEVLQRYGARGAVVVRSDESGAAQWRLQGAATRLERWRIDHPRYWTDRPATAAAPVDEVPAPDG